MPPCTTSYPVYDMFFLILPSPHPGPILIFSEEMSATEKAVEMASPTATASKPKRINKKKKPYLERLKGPSKAYLGREAARKNREAAAQKAAEAAAREAAAEAAAAAEAEAPAEEASE